MQSASSIVQILGTGGTIAGTAASQQDNVGYRAAQVGVAELVAAVPALAGLPLAAEQVAQVDSKDMSFDVWLALARRVAHFLALPEVRGIVITHGTDTLEETAYFLQRVLAPAKPVVLTAAMRPATSLQADGPQNLLDAVTVAQSPLAHGVVAVVAGAVHSARDVRKVHPYRLDAFSSGDSGPLAWVEEGRLRVLRPWPADLALGLGWLPADVSGWPAVEIVTSHAGASGDGVRALCAAGVRGIVVATTGNGTLHHRLDEALAEAARAGVAVLRSTRCLDGHILEAKPLEAGPLGAEPAAGGAFASADDLTPVKARIELMLRLMAAAA